MSLCSEHGVRGLWRGVGPTLLRDVPFSMVYWTGYQWLRRSTAMQRLVSSLGGGNSSLSSEFTAAFLSGTIAGSVAALVTTPFDVVKTRVQGYIAPVVAVTDTSGIAASDSRGQLRAAVPEARGVPAAISSAAVTGVTGGGGVGVAVDGVGVSSHPRPAPVLTVESSFRMLKQVLAEEGLRGVFAGVGARVVKVAPACAIMVSSYEIGKRVCYDFGV